MQYIQQRLFIGKFAVFTGGMLAFALSGAAAHFSAMLAERFPDSAWTVVALYWFFLVMGGLLLVFPLTVADEHFARVADRELEETPAHHWLREFALELAVFFGAGCITSALMAWTPVAWWMILTAIWAWYHHIYNKMFAVSVTTYDEEEPLEALPELRDEIKPYAEKLSINLTGARLLPDADVTPMLPVDALWVRQDTGEEERTVLYMPRAWIAEWTTPELVAVALHKAWIDRPVMARARIALRVAQGMLGLGGFALARPWLAPGPEAGAVELLPIMPLLAVWFVAILFALRPLELALERRWTTEADAAVATIMESPDGLLAALHRAKEEMKEEPEPFWVKLLFSTAPSIDERVARIHSSPNAEHRNLSASL